MNNRYTLLKFIDLALFILYGFFVFFFWYNNTLLSKIILNVLVSSSWIFGIIITSKKKQHLQKQNHILKILAWIIVGLTFISLAFPDEWNEHVYITAIFLLICLILPSVLYLIAIYHRR